VSTVTVQSEGVVLSSGDIGGIIGGVLGVFLICIVTVVFFYVLRRKKPKHKDTCTVTIGAPYEKRNNEYQLEECTNVAQGSSHDPIVESVETERSGNLKDVVLGGRLRPVEAEYAPW